MKWFYKKCRLITRKTWFNFPLRRVWRNGKQRWVAEERGDEARGKERSRVTPSKYSSLINFGLHSTVEAFAPYEITSKFFIPGNGGEGGGR